MRTTSRAGETVAAEEGSPTGSWRAGESEEQKSFSEEDKHWGSVSAYCRRKSDKAFFYLIISWPCKKLTFVNVNRKEAIYVMFTELIGTTDVNL